MHLNYFGTVQIVLLYVISKNNYLNVMRSVRMHMINNEDGEDIDATFNIVYKEVFRNV